MWHEELRNAREKRGWSQRELASRLNMPQSHLWKIENGIVNSRLSTIAEIARLLGLEPVLVPRALLPVVESLLRSDKLPKRRSIAEALTGVEQDIE